MKKLQIPNPKSQKSSNLQIPNQQTDRGLRFGIWNLFGVWDLGFGVSRSRPKSREAFTMIEIAISLAVIGFALVAIIGILPTGMNVQKENREETIIGQDSQLFMDAIRSGAKGMDELTNYVVAITNWQRAYDARGRPLGARPSVYFYTYTN